MLFEDIQPVRCVWEAVKIIREIDGALATGGSNKEETNLFKTVVIFGGDVFGETKVTLSFRQSGLRKDIDVLGVFRNIKTDVGNIVARVVEGRIGIVAGREI